MLVPVMARADYITLYPHDFVPNGKTGTYWTPGEHLELDTGQPASYFYAPLHLPDNAKITAMTVFFEDNSTSNLSVYIWRDLLYSTGVNTIVGWISSGATAGLQNEKTTSVNFAFNKILNSGATYIIQVYFTGGDGSNLRFHAVRIFYTP